MKGMGAWGLVCVVACGGAPPPAASPRIAPAVVGLSASPVATTTQPSATDPFPSRKATRKYDARWMTCHNGFEGHGSLLEDLAGRGQACAAITGMRAVGAPIQGRHEAEKASQRYPLRANAGPEADDATIVVTSDTGSGAYAIQVWSD